MAARGRCGLDRWNEPPQFNRSYYKRKPGIRDCMTEIQINRSSSFAAVALGATAVGALAIGAAAIGALAIGALTIRKLRLVEGRLKDLHIDRLTIGELDLQSKHQAE